MMKVVKISDSEYSGSVRMSKIAKKHIKINISVTGKRLFGIRFWAGTNIMKLAGYILPCELEIEVNAQ